MSGERLPELLRGLGIEPFLDDATTLQRLADAITYRIFRTFRIDGFF
jgi:hypothetical protein